MKQRLYQLVWLSLFTALLLWQFGHYLTAFNLGSKGDLVNFDEATVATVYPLNASETLAFPLNSARFPLRVLSNATISQPSFQALTAGVNLANGDEPVRWHYQVRYEILDDKDQVLESKNYHFWSYPQQYQLPNQPGLITKNFYADSRQIAADTRLMIIAPEPQVAAKARQLRVTVPQLDPGLEEVALRVYERITLDDKQIAYRWQRLNNKQKEAIVEGNIYGPEFLSEAEKLNLLRYRVQPLGALGVFNQDYRQQKLYSRDLLDELPEQYQLYSAGYNFGGHLLAVFPVADDLMTKADTSQLLRWQFNRRESLNRESARPAEDLVQFTWISEDGREQATWSQTIQDKSQVERVLKKGMVMLASTEQWLVRQWQQPFNNEPDGPVPIGSAVETEPTLSQLRVYQVQANPNARLSALSEIMPLRYRIPTYTSQAVPLRVDLRQRLNPDQPQHIQPVAIMRWFDQNGRKINEYPLQTTAELNRFEQVSAAPDVQLSVPRQHFFMLPAEVAEIEITGSDQHFISLYTRPNALPRQVNVPEDYQVFNGQTKRPYWFLIHPTNQQQLMQQQSALLELRPQPKSALDPDLLTGHYHWQSYTPEGDWLGRYLISPRDSKLPLRLESAPQSFLAMQAGRSYSVRFQHAYRPQVQPSVLFFRKGIQAEKVQFLLNNTPWFSTHIGQSQGKIDLPMISTQSLAKLRIQSNPNIQWYLSHQLNEQNSYLKRLVSKVPRSGVIEIPFEKTEGRETLNLMFYQDVAHLARTQLSVEILPIQLQQPLRHKQSEAAQQEWTALKRQYNIALDVTQQSQVLEKNQQLYSTYPAYLTLAEDLPKGRYQLKLTLNSKQTEYFSVFQRLSGAKDPNDIYFEALPGRYDD